MRPPGPVPDRLATSMPCSFTNRRTTGESRTLLGALLGAAARTGAGFATGAGAGAGAGFATGAGAGAGAGAGFATGAGAGVGAGDGAGAAPLAAPTTAITVPTGTVSPAATRISVSVPEIGDGTSVSTLSVDTSKSGSSAATESPTFLNHRVMVPSVTVSPSCGRITSATASSLLRHALILRPVSDNTVSPNSSVRLGCGWMNSAISSTVASQLTAR